VLGIQANGETTEIRFSIVTAENTVLVLVAYTRRELAAVGAAGDVDVMVGGDGILVTQNV